MRSVFLVVIVSIGISTISFAQKSKDDKRNVSTQCDINQHVNKCVESLRPRGYRFLKSYKLEGNASKPIEYQYTLSKGTTYFFSLQQANPDTKLKITLFSPDGREETSNYNKKLNKYYPSMEIRCQRTGVYKIIFSQEGKQDFCAASVLGFKR